MRLKNSEHIGKIIVHPENSDVIFVAAIDPLWNKGGDRGLYKSIDGEKTWAKINKGLPKVEMERIGLCVSPADLEIIYAIVEAAEGKGGFYRTTNRGAN